MTLTAHHYNDRLAGEQN